MIFALTTALLLPALSHAQFSCSRYLKVTLWDSFGDGWGDAEWHLEDPSNTVSAVELTCSEDEKVFTIFPSDFSPSEGTYEMSIASTGLEIPTNWWEIYWLVEEMEFPDSPTGVYYEGSYDTVMTWTYACGFEPDFHGRALPILTESWTLTNAENLPDFSCSGCSGSKCNLKQEDKKKSPEKKPSTKEAPKRNKPASKAKPSAYPTAEPTISPTSSPTSSPTRSPTQYPTSIPSGQPSSMPTQPTGQPTSMPTGQPSSQPTSMPSGQPSSMPTQPTGQPTSDPTSSQPTSDPTSSQPTSMPTQPTGQPTSDPTSSQPTSMPTQPTGQPTSLPTMPTSIPTGQPSALTAAPSESPTVSPTAAPSFTPSVQPSRAAVSKPKAKRPRPIKKVRKPRSKKSPDSSHGSESFSEDIVYGKRDTDLKVKMYAEECNGKKCDKSNDCSGWEDMTPIGAHWYIADATQTYLFEDGTLCDKCHGSCDMCLGDGSYVFRVTGYGSGNETTEADRPYSAWDFCHARGFFNDQLNFHIKKGKCYPDNLRWSNELCEEEDSLVTITGVIALAGIPSEFFVHKATNIVLELLAQTVDGWSVEQMAVTATSLDSRTLLAHSRALRSYTHDIQFSVTFSAEDYSVDGAVYAAVENLISDMGSTLEAAFNYGNFTGALMAKASTMSVDVLETVTTVELVSLSVANIYYPASHLVYYYDSEDVSVSSESSSSLRSNTVAVLFFAVLGAGFFAFVGIARNGMTSYSRLNTVTDTEHAFKQQQDMISMVRTPFGENSQKYTTTARGLQI